MAKHKLVHQRLPLANDEPLLVERMAAAHHDHGLVPGQHTWDEKGDFDERKKLWREKMQAAMHVLYREG